MYFYKILTDSNGLRYRRGLNINSQPMDPRGTVIEEDGLRFARENIFQMLGRGDYVRQVHLTLKSKVYEDFEGLYRADELMLSKRRDLDFIRIKSLLSEGADIHAGDDRAIRWACNLGAYQVVKLLLEEGATPNTECLNYASVMGHYRIARTLIEAGVKPCKTAIRWAQGNNRTRIVNLLIKNL